MSEEIESMMKEERIYYPPKDLSRNAYIKSMEEYEKLYRESIDNPEGFWARQAEESLSWFKKWERVLEYDFTRIGEIEGPYLKFFQGGRLNISYNCLDRHLDSWRRNKAAIIWQGEDEREKRTLTYQQLHTQVCRFTNVLIKHGIKRGDVVTIYLPMIPELPVAMLACTRIGAIHSVVFSAFSADALRHRILDCNSKMVITSDVGFHGGKVVDLKNKTDKALSDGLKSIEKVIVYNRGNSKVDMKPGRDYWWHEEVNASDITDRCMPAEMDSEDPLFILYTSGSTGKPKGVLHTTAGYLLHVNLSFKWIFDVKDKDIFNKRLFLGR